MTPKAVVFDIGKVLLDFDYGIAAQAMERHCEARLILRTLYYNRTHPDRIGFQKFRPENRAEKLKSDQAYRRAMKLLDSHE